MINLSVMFCFFSTAYLLHLESWKISDFSPNCLSSGKRRDMSVQREGWRKRKGKVVKYKTRLKNVREKKNTVCLSVCWLRKWGNDRRREKTRLNLTESLLWSSAGLDVFFPNLIHYHSKTIKEVQYIQNANTMWRPTVWTGGTGISLKTL